MMREGAEGARAGNLYLAMGLLQRHDHLPALGLRRSVRWWWLMLLIFVAVMVGCVVLR
jgi:hypothetical protein